ncbi:hypothetical protein OV079_27935 [Nannocystis pusilla]|uniref:Uncharacterized protein n=1 Tax=Nannocystis pusilla TaxID=889268 RepID=A0A9X3IYA5_9BACT|nr:hypothetical protein [Nannocystis pusilla]MCY1009327.1 hypothetical protein [Nannocystis pusilla]
MSSGSLRWRLVRRLVALQAALLAIFWLSLLGLSWLSGGPIMALESEDRVLDIVRESIARAPDGASSFAPRPRSPRCAPTCQASGSPSTTRRDIG